MPVVPQLYVPTLTLNGRSSVTVRHSSMKFRILIIEVVFHVFVKNIQIEILTFKAPKWPPKIATKIRALNVNRSKSPQKTTKNDPTMGITDQPYSFLVYASKGSQ